MYVSLLLLKHVAQVLTENDDIFF